MKKFLRLIVICFTTMPFLSNAYSCDRFLQKYKTECDIQNRYLKLKAGFKKHNVDIDFLTEFRAIRFIARRDMKRTIKEKPKGFLTWDIYSPAPKTWLKWEEGNFHRSIVSAEMQCLSNKGKGWKFSTASLEKLHEKTIGGGLAGPMEKIPIVKGLFPKPGEIRKRGHANSGFMVRKWMKRPLNKQEVGLIKNFELKDKDGNPLVRTTMLFQIPDVGNYIKKYSKTSRFGSFLSKKFRGQAYGQVGYLRSKRVPYEMARLFKHINEAIRFYKTGKRTSGDSDFDDFDYKRTPLQVVADLQRRYIAIHPFHEGNGRMSRFIQDMLLQLFKLPPSPAGDLQSDVLTTNAVYRKETVEAFKLAMTNLESCLKQYDKGGKVEPRCTHMYEAHSSESESIKADKNKFLKVFNDSISKIKSSEKTKCIGKSKLQSL